VLILQIEPGELLLLYPTTRWRWAESNRRPRGCSDGHRGRLLAGLFPLAPPSAARLSLRAEALRPEPRGEASGRNPSPPRRPVRCLRPDLSTASRRRPHLQAYFGALARYGRHRLPAPFDDSPSRLVLSVRLRPHADGKAGRGYAPSFTAVSCTVDAAGEPRPREPDPPGRWRDEISPIVW